MSSHTGSGFGSIIGHGPAVRLLQRTLVLGHMAHAYLFLGPPHVGKTTLALAFAQALLCEDPSVQQTGAACGVCAACRRVREGTHPDLRLVEPEGVANDDAPESRRRKAASRVQIKIETIRELQHDLALRPYLGQRRVIIVTQAESLNEAAENALLKTLEEPPAYAVLLLTASEVEGLLPTTVSRCQQVMLGVVPRAEIVAALETAGLSSAEAERLAALSGGRVGWALHAARHSAALNRHESQLEHLARVLSADRIERFHIAEELAKHPEDLADLLLVWQGWWRDALLLQAGCEPWVVNVDRQPALEHAAHGLDTRTVLGALHALRRAADDLESNANPRLTLEVLHLSLPKM